MVKVRRQELPLSVSGLCWRGAASQDNTILFLKYQGLLSMETQMLVEKADGPLSCRAFARCLAFTPSRWSCFTLYRWLNIHWARERKTRDWFYCPVVWVLTWDVRDARSSPCSKDDLIIYTNWKGSSKKDAMLFFSTLLTRGLAWHRFFPCHANASFLHCDLVTSFLFSKQGQEILGGIHTGGSSWRDMAPCPPATHFPPGTGFSLLLSQVPTSIPGTSALFTVYMVEEAQAGHQATVRNPRFSWGFPGFMRTTVSTE